MSATDVAQLADLMELRQRYESQVAMDVLRKDWDNASAIALKAEQVDIAIVALVLDLRRKGTAPPE